MVPSPGATGRRGTLPDLCRPRRIAARRPRAFGPLCRPEASCCENAVRRVGQPPWWRRRLGTPTSGRHALRDRAAHGTAPTCAMVPSPGATGRRGRSRTSAAQDNKRRVARGPSARCAGRRPAFQAAAPSCSIGGSRSCPGCIFTASGLWSAPRCANAQRAAWRPPAGWFCPSVQRGGGDIPDLCSPRRLAPRRPRAFGPLCRPEAGVPSRGRPLLRRRYALCGPRRPACLPEASPQLASRSTSSRVLRMFSKLSWEMT